MTENQSVEYKSIRKIRTGDKGFKELAKTCVGFANSLGGKVIIGIEDNDSYPPINQLIENSELNETMTRLKNLTSAVGFKSYQILKHDNNSDFIEIEISPNKRSIAITSDGKVYTRFSDTCVPVASEDLHTLLSERDNFIWELIPKKIELKDIPSENIHLFLTEIRNSDVVRNHVKNMSDLDLLENYNLISSGKLTNLGVLWLGDYKQRSKLAYPIEVKYIVYNDMDEVIRKIIWNDHHFNPKELLYEIESSITELNYEYEIADGLLRNKVRHYPKEALRELLVNSFAHKTYTTATDITIQVYPESMKITSPGGFPYGVTKDNILNTKGRRNTHLIKIFQDLKLMEAEGSGYDLIYEKLIEDGKQLPVITSDFNHVSVELKSRIIDIESLKITEYILKHFKLNQKSKIALGIIARHKKLLSTKLSKILQLSDEERLRTWTSSLTKQEIILTRGSGKGNAFIINPKLLSNSKLNIKPTLKTIESHVLEELIQKDLEIHPLSSIGQIKSRIKDVDKRDIQKCLYKLVKNNKIAAIGSKTYRKYRLAEKKRNEKEI
ncbi:MAG: ATP-binding protein [Candidatus Kapaibacterium sp.]|nr:putative DNA binding domain-containing protein [Ignavibacteria bacterium]